MCSNVSRQQPLIGNHCVFFWVTEHAFLFDILVPHNDFRVCYTALYVFFELIYITHSLPGVWERFFDSLWVDQRQLLSLFVVSSKRGGTERVQTLSHFAHSESQLAKGTEPSRDSSRPSLAMFAIIF